MRSLSKGLVQGSIDQVEELVNITWVQPRVLSPQQVCFYLFLLNFFFYFEI